MFQVYLSITVWLFFYGPWPWQVNNGQTLFFYLAASQLAIAVGYGLSWKRVQAARAVPFTEGDIATGLAFLKRAMWITLVLAIPTSMSRAGTVIPDVLGGLHDVGLAYNDTVDRFAAVNSWVVAEYARIVMGPWLTALFPLTVFYWGRMSLGMRLAAAGLIAFNLAIYIATGVNKGFADIVITLPWVLFLSVSAGLLRIKRFRLKASVASAILLVAFVAFFTTGQTQRQGSGTDSGTFNSGFVIVQADSDNFISSLLPDDLRVAYEALSRYVVQGYYALSMSFETDTPSTLGVGNSMFLARNADLVTGSTFFENQSIPGALERDSGWGQFTLWHSIYPWLASDFGFPGTLVVMAGFGYLLGWSWGTCIVRPLPARLLMLYLLIIVFFYIPANNQVFQSGEGCGAFFICLFWLWRARRADEGSRSANLLSPQAGSATTLSP